MNLSQSSSLTNVHQTVKSVCSFMCIKNNTMYTNANATSCASSTSCHFSFLNLLKCKNATLVHATFSEFEEKFELRKQTECRIAMQMYM